VDGLENDDDPATAGIDPVAAVQRAAALIAAARAGLQAGTLADLDGIRPSVTALCEAVRGLPAPAAAPWAVPLLLVLKDLSGLTTEVLQRDRHWRDASRWCRSGSR
jgi:hypothetical protein